MVKTADDASARSKVTRIRRADFDALTADPLIGMLPSDAMLAVVTAGWWMLTARQKADALAAVHAENAPSAGAGEGPQLDTADRDAMDDPAPEDVDVPPRRPRAGNGHPRRRQPAP